MKNKEDWYETEFELSNGDSVYIVHNVPVKGQHNSIDAAFENWINRTNKYTSSSFAKYINSKGVHKAFTKQEYLKLKRN